MGTTDPGEVIIKGSRIPGFEDSSERLKNRPDNVLREQTLATLICQTLDPLPP
jgi:hypothetical protein